MMWATRYHRRHCRLPNAIDGLFQKTDSEQCPDESSSIRQRQAAIAHLIGSLRSFKPQNGTGRGRAATLFMIDIGSLRKERSIVCGNPSSARYPA